MPVDQRSERPGGHGGFGAGFLLGEVSGSISNSRGCTGSENSQLCCSPGHTSSVRYTSPALLVYFKPSACEREYFWCFSGTVKRQTERLAAGWEEGAVPVVGTPGDATGAGAGARAGRAEAGAETWGHACSPPAGRVR